MVVSWVCACAGPCAHVCACRAGWQCLFVCVRFFGLLLCRVRTSVVCREGLPGGGVHSVASGACLVLPGGGVPSVVGQAVHAYVAALVEQLEQGVQGSAWF